MIATCQLFLCVCLATGAATTFGHVVPSDDMLDEWMESRIEQALMQFGEQPDSTTSSPTPSNLDDAYNDSTDRFVAQVLRVIDYAPTLFEKCFCYDVLGQDLDPTSNDLSTATHCNVGKLETRCTPYPFCTDSYELHCYNSYSTTIETMCEFSCKCTS